MKKIHIFYALLAISGSIQAENCCGDLKKNTYYISGSALLWDADEEGIDFVYKNEQGFGSLTDASLKELSPKWNCGYRIEAGAALPCFGLETEFAWTHFSSHAHEDAEAPLGGALFSVWTSPNTLTSPTSGTGEWDLSLNLYLWEVGKTFCLNNCIDVIPNIGLIGGSINQHIDLNFNGGVAVGSSYPVLDDKIRMTNNYWGVGLRGGLKGLWQWTKCMGLYAKGAFSVLNGHFNVEQHESVLFSNVNGYTNVLDVNDRFYRARILTELGVGVYWETAFLSCGRFALQVGWEQLYFFGQNQLNRYTSSDSPGIHTSTNGDLSLQGVTIRGTFVF